MAPLLMVFSVGLILVMGLLLSNLLPRSKCGRGLAPDGGVSAKASGGLGCCYRGQAPSHIFGCDRAVIWVAPLLMVFSVGLILVMGLLLSNLLATV
ncbi:MAG: hypothetical protein LKM38_10140 [Pseudomonas veronii]|nr:hypothetical protein [Pseudomonas veronii]